MLRQNYLNHFKVLKNKIVEKEYLLNEVGISSLMGASSRLIFLAHLGNVENKKKTYEKIILKDLNAMLDHIENYQVSACNIDGLAGFGSAVASVLRMGYLQEMEQTVLCALDDFILQSAQVDFEASYFDFFYGGLGHVQYLICRSGSNEKIDRTLVNLLDTKIFVQIENQDFSFLQEENENTIDFSGAHGLGSVIFFLNKLIDKEIAVERCLSLMCICCRFIISHCVETDQGWRIPDLIDHERPVFSPLRWCHGELGIIPALTMANEKLKDPDDPIFFFLEFHVLKWGFV